MPSAAAGGRAPLVSRPSTALRQSWRVAPAGLVARERTAMAILRTVLVCLALLAGGYLLVNGGAYTSGPDRKKLEIEVATPHGVARGASVIEARHSRAPWWFPTGTGNRNSAGFTGEAPYAEIGVGRYLFVAVNDPRTQAPILEQFTRWALR